MTLLSKNNYQRASVLDTRAAADSGQEPSQRPSAVKGARNRLKRTSSSYLRHLPGGRANGPPHRST
jgi:hypothetical protein